MTAPGAATVFPAVVAAEASAVSGYPYARGHRVIFSVSIDKPTQRIFPGQEADFTVWSSNSSEYQGYGKVVLTIELPPGATPVGPPACPERGSGCTRHRPNRLPARKPLTGG